MRIKPGDLFRVVEFDNGKFAVQVGDNRYLYAPVWRDYVQRDSSDTWLNDEIIVKHCCFDSLEEAQKLLNSLCIMESRAKPPVKLKVVRVYR